VVQETINAAIDRGVAFLLDAQELDGTWLYGSQGARPGCTALATYALLKSGVPPGHHAIRRALVSLEIRPPGQTYDVACLLLALDAHDPSAHREWIAGLTESLRGWQDGDFGYPGGRDLSNTQYGALGLWAAARSGVPVANSAWAALARATLGYQGQDGGFGYHRGGHASTGSMTTAGVGVLAICLDALYEEGSASPLAKRMIAARDRGLGWLASHFTVRDNPGQGAWVAYYLYGLERVGALANVETIGDHDWYREGAEFLVRGQAPDGHWETTFAPGIPQTCFALLFLRRATLSVTGQTAARRRARYASDAEGLPVHLFATGDDPLAVWIAEWNEEVLGNLVRPEEQGRGPRVARVEYLVDGVPVKTVWGRSDEPAGDRRFEARLSLPEPGTYELAARVHLLGRPTEIAGHAFPGLEHAREIPPVTVVIEEATPEWMLENARDPIRNLLRGSTPRVTASSSFTGWIEGMGGGFAPSNAIDDVQSTCWLADEADEAPVLTIHLRSARHADVIVLGHARTRPARPGYLARALEVRATVNGTDEHVIQMDPDVRRKTRFRLPRPMRIRDLELRIPWKAPGSADTTAVGFSEVELQLFREER